MKAYISPDIPRGQPPNSADGSTPKVMHFQQGLWETAKALAPARRRKLVDAALSLHFDGIVPEDLPPDVSLALSGWIDRIQCARSKSLSSPTAAQNSKNEEKSDSFQTRKPHGFLVENTDLSADLTAETSISPRGDLEEIEIESELSKSRSELSPEIPTREQVRRYVECCGIHEIDPDKFFNHYEKAGWKTKDGKPISDWRGMIRQWQLYEGKFVNDEEEVVKDTQSKLELKLMGRDLMKGTWIYTGGRNGADFLQGSESWTEDRAAAELQKLQEELEGQAQH